MSVSRVLQNPASVGMYGGAVCAIWPSIHLFNFAADPVSVATLPEDLRGYDPYLAAGGLGAFLLSAIGLTSAFIKTWKG